MLAIDIFPKDELRAEEKAPVMAGSKGEIANGGNESIVTAGKTALEIFFHVVGDEGVIVEDLNVGIEDRDALGKSGFKMKDVGPATDASAAAGGLEGALVFGIPDFAGGKGESEADQPSGLGTVASVVEDGPTQAQGHIAKTDPVAAFHTIVVEVALGDDAVLNEGGSSDGGSIGMDGSAVVFGKDDGKDKEEFEVFVKTDAWADHHLVTSTRGIKFGEVIKEAIVVGFASTLGWDATRAVVLFVGGDAAELACDHGRLGLEAIGELETKAEGTVIFVIKRIRDIGEESRVSGGKEEEEGHKKNPYRFSKGTASHGSSSHKSGS